MAMKFQGKFLGRQALNLQHLLQTRSQSTITAGLHIGGKQVAAVDKATFTVEDPAHLTPIAEVATASPADVDMAVQCAHEAFQDGRWSSMAPRARARILFAAAKALREDLGEMAVLESRQTGRTLREYKAQLGRVPEWIEYHASLAASSGLEGRVPQLVEQDHMNYVRRVPLGVCALITPWNHPLLITVKKAAVALAAGNTVVVKPPLVAPLTVLRFARLLEESGLPAGVFNVVQGDGPAAGEALVSHPLVERIDFTGGTSTGVRIAQVMASAGKVRPYCAELGGNAPVLVFDDCDLQQAVNGVAFAAFVASGQTCVSAKRILVQQTLYKDFVEALVAKVQGLSMGNPLDAGTDLGPVVTAGQWTVVNQLTSAAIQEGAIAACGGARPSQERCPFPGHFFEPTVLTGVDTKNTAFVEEIFGPVISVTPFATEEEGIALANCSKYGLGAGVWTKDVRRAHMVTSRLRSGVMWVNCHHRNDPSSPWGGFGESGIGRENGPESLEEYTTSKSVTMRLNDTPEDWFGSKTARYG
mmetsp:Transcript_40173/g.92334  ORF Transcript_40173/g.92334 Transcript_40173/m.92334 type:complete len:530 (-) Transcript_40173:314-1903(-)